jgi:ABC-2 type transport system permease protein
MTMVITFANNSLQVGTLSNIIITPSCMIGGCFWSLDLMPDYMKKAANFMPQKWTLEAVTKLQKGGTLQEIYFQIIILLMFSAAFFLIAAYKLKKSKDMRDFV